MLKFSLGYESIYTQGTLLHIIVCTGYCRNDYSHIYVFVCIFEEVTVSPYCSR